MGKTAPSGGRSTELTSLWNTLDPEVLEAAVLRVDLPRAKPGMVLALPVTHPQRPDHVLLRSGCPLDDALIGRLEEMRVRHLWVRYPGLEFLSAFVNPQVLSAQSQVYRQMAQTFEAMQQQAVARLPYDEYCRNLGEMVRLLVEDPQAALFMGDLADPCMQHLDLVRHSSTVTFLAILMGLKLGGYLVRQRRHIPPARASQVTNLGLGAMLHDLGASQLPVEVRQRYQESHGDEADPEWREHPSLGYQIVRTRIEPSAATVLLHHHQHYDGWGYAGSAAPMLAGQRIHIFARIVALAETFDRLRHPLGRPSLPSVAVLGMLHAPSRASQFDPKVLTALFCVVPAYPPGALLRLSDDRLAVCVDHHPNDPCRPVVRILNELDHAEPDEQALGETLDLQTLPEALHIVACDGEFVASHNFPAPTFMADAGTSLAYL
ncbi:MAG: HD domain-containing phosphohydrolase [Phycisphaeraceae bacterium]